MKKRHKQKRLWGSQGPHACGGGCGNGNSLDHGHAGTWEEEVVAFFEKLGFFWTFFEIFDQINVFLVFGIKKIKTIK